MDAAVEFINIDKNIIKNPGAVAAVMRVLPGGFSLAAPDFLVVIAAEDSVPVGAVCLKKGLVAEVTWLFVVPEYRHRKIASELLNHVHTEMAETMANVEFVCRFSIDAATRQSDLLGFFDSVEDVDIDLTGAVYEASPANISDSVQKLPIYKHKKTAAVNMLFDMPDEKVKEFLGNGHVSDVFEISDYDELKLKAVKELCLCYVRNNEIHNVMITTRRDDRTLSLDLMYSLNAVALRNMLTSYGQILTRRFPDHSLLFNPINDVSYGVMENVLTEVTTREYMCEATWM